MKMQPADLFEIESSKFLVTGGTGSFGSTVTRRLLEKGAKEVRILSRDEAKQDAMRHSIRDDRVRFFLGDVRDLNSVNRAMNGVDYVFHAAALKQVPSCEFFPLEAVQTNIHGSANVARAALENSLKAAVFLSTDKAVYPINAMGMSKALMEKTVTAFSRESANFSTRINVTRYGNVMYSRGSVIPLFVRQLRSGDELTLTDPQMTRFLMSLEESVDLVLHAFEAGQSGDLFVRKAPAATIETLARALGNLFGTVPRIKTIGTRHGEKLHESLLSSEERMGALDEGDYFRVPLDTRSLNYELFTDRGTSVQEPHQAFSSENTRRLSVEEVESLLLALPEIRRELSSVD